MKLFPVPYLHFLKKLTFAFFVPCLFAISCKQVTKDYPDHPEYTDKIIARSSEFQSTNYLDSAYARLVDPGPGDLWKKYFFKERFALHHECNLPKAKRYADSMSFIIRGKRELYKYEYGNTVSATAQIFLEEKKYEDAIKLYEDYRLLLQKSMDSCALVEVHSGLAGVLARQEKYIMAIDYLKKAIEASDYCNRAHGFNFTLRPQSYYNSIGVYYERAGLADSAIVYYKLGLAFIDRATPKSALEQRNVNVAKGVILGNLGGAYATLNNYAEAEKHLKAARAINDRPGFDIEDAQTVSLKLAGLYSRAGHFKSADSVLKKLEQDISSGRAMKSYMNKTIRLRLYQQKWAYYTAIRDTVHAYNYALNYYALRDSMNKNLQRAETNNSLLYMRGQYEQSIRHKNRQLKQLAWVAGVVFVLMSAALAMLWRRFKKVTR